jgi:hypothetical protein
MLGIEPAPEDESALENALHPSTWEKGCLAKFASRILHCDEVFGEAVLGVLDARVF